MFNAKNKTPYMQFAIFVTATISSTSTAPVSSSTGRRPSVDKKRAKVSKSAAAQPPPADDSGQEVSESLNSHPFFGGAHVQNYSYGRDYGAYGPGKEQRICSLFRKK